MELDYEQNLAVHATEPRVLVLAGAGSGKTRLLTERVRYLLDTGVDPSMIVAITFTNMAAEEMRERLGDISNNVFIGTIHSYANRLLTRHGFKTFKFIKEEEFDKFFELIKKNPNVIEHVEHLLVDEFQDTSTIQYDFFQQVNPTNLYVVGDDAQSIYQFAGSDVAKFRKLARSDDFMVYQLKMNYRCGYNILTFASEFLHGDPDRIIKPVKCVEGHNGDVDAVNWGEDEIIDFFLENNDYENWFVLAFTNNEVDRLIYKFKQNGIPCCTFKKSEVSKNEMNEMMHAPQIKVLTVHSAKGLESPKVLVQNFYANDAEKARLRYVAATRAADLLIWNYGKRKVKPRRAYTSSWE